MLHAEGEKDIIAILTDGDNRDPILLVNDEGKKCLFDQIAVIPLDPNGDGDIILYAFLRPREPIEGVAEDEAVMFRAGVDKDGKDVLYAETDSKAAYAAYDEYLKLYAEAHGKPTDDE